MALLSTQQITPNTGLAPTYAAVAASDTFVPDSDTFIHVLNTNAATRTVTVTSARTASGGRVITSPVGTVAATTGSLMMGPFPASDYADPTTGLATVTCSVTTNVTIAVIACKTPVGS